ncbi:MAG: AraC-like DNA-binding protein [Alphaproteobacteria bacterium]|jgi:AraC-like DNA-binding protein
MDVRYIYLILLTLSILFLVAQLLVKKKRGVHLVFAIFCGSMAMVAAKQIGADILNPYHYLIGLGTCATCNAFWLVSRGLFRHSNAIESRHVAVAAAIAILIMCSQMLQMTSELSQQPSSFIDVFANAVSTLTQFLSSTILTLTFWEALRGYSHTSGSAKHQRTIFMFVFGSAVFMCMFVAQVFLSKTQFNTLFPWFTAISAISILCTTQVILLWQHIESKEHSNLDKCVDELFALQAPDCEAKELIDGIKTFVEMEEGFLQSSLKMKDVAYKLDVSEYRISRIIRLYFKAENFNQYINELRIDHAKTLLVNSANKRWTILVIALESGFSSIVSFNRVFKSMCGCTPSEYRQQAKTPSGEMKALSVD